MNLTREMADRIASVALKQIPEEAYRHAQRCMIDGLSVAVAGANETSTRLVRDFALNQGQASGASLWAHPAQTTPLMAALVNGVAAHALDYDDIHQAVPLHGTVGVLPAIVAVAEDRNTSMADLLLAFAVGLETSIRIGLALGRSHTSRGWHPTGTVNTFGAAAGAGKILGLDADGFANALALAAGQASGLLHTVVGTMAKSLNAGKAAMNGLLSAMLAERGFTGPRDVFTLEKGYPQAASDEFDPSRLNSDWSSRWELADISFKLIAAGSLAHTAFYGARSIHMEESVRPEDIAEIELDVCQWQVDIVGLKTPTKGLDGKFSLTYCAALGLAGRRGFLEDFSDDGVQEPVLVSLMGKIKYKIIPEKSVTACQIRVRMKDGRTIQRHVPVPRGFPGNRANEEELEEKHRSLMEPVLGKAAVDEILTLVRESSDVTPVTRLTKVLAQPKR